MKPFDYLLITCMPVINSSEELKYFQRSSGPYVLATSLRKLGYSVKVVDCAASWNEEQWIAIFRKFVSASTKAIGISTTFYDREFDQYILGGGIDPKIQPLGLPFTKTTIKKLKKLSMTLNPDLEWIVGGNNSLIVQMQVPGIFDRVFIGYSDQQFLDYVKMREGELPEYSELRIWNYDPKGDRFDFRSSQIIYHQDDTILPNETMCIEIARGCIFKCSFCSFSLNGKKKNDYLKDPIFLRDELIRNYEEFGITSYTTSDDTHNDSVEKLEQLYKVVRDLPFDFSYNSYLRLDLLARQPGVPELLMEMGFLGTYFGVETFHKQAAIAVGKGGMPAEKLKDFLIHLKQDIWKDQVKVTLGFIVGLPHETRDSLEETVLWLEKNPQAFDTVMFWPLIATNGKVPYPGYDSKLATNPDKYGLYYANDAHPWEWQSNLKDNVASYTEACTLSRKLLDRILPLQGLGGVETLALSSYEKEIQEFFGMGWKDFVRLPKAKYRELMKTGKFNHEKIYRNRTNEYFQNLMSN